ncbi:MAG: hypothetical protein V7K91_30140 [Nostoc sp.]
MPKTLTRQVVYFSLQISSKNTPSSTIETFEGIETAVRDQILEHVSPKIAFFLSEKRLEQPQDVSEP